jgi:molecular chaperone GrpE
MTEAEIAKRRKSDDVEHLQRALAEEQQHTLNLVADLYNVRRRATSEQEFAQHGGRRAALLPLLPVFDALERALATGSTDPHFYEGVAATFRLFATALAEAGVESFDSVGQPFDPAIHEAAAIECTDDVKPGTVTRQVLRGWRLNGDLLRPAHVIVAANGDEAT